MTQSPDICACGGKVAHTVIDGATELARMCETCFEQYLRDRHAANLPITPGWAKRLGLHVTACASCGSGIPDPGNYVGGRAVCGQACAETLLASLPKPEPRVFPKTGEVTQLPLLLTYLRT